MPPTSLQKSKIKILLLEGIHDSAVTAFSRAGYSNVECVEGSLGGNELARRIRSVQFLGVRSRTQVDVEALESAQKLIAIGCFCIGTNQVDLDSASERGIAVFNAPYSNTRSVAELVLAEAILLLRGIPAKSAQCHLGHWNKSATNSHETRGKTLGIVGYGNIGTQLGILAEGLGMNVIYYDVATKLPLGNARPLETLDRLLSLCDVISLHVPETEATERMIGREQLALLRKGAIVINASRGRVVDIDALTEALDSGHVSGAAVDVFPEEPRKAGDEFVSPLRGRENVILTPHIGGSTVEAQKNIGIEVSEKLAQFSDTGTTTSAVNFPEVALPTHAGRHRILHIHKNIPGMMSQINSALSDDAINIGGQYLQTNEKVGYVVIDVDQDCGPLAFDRIKKIQGTIRARILF